MEKVGRPGQIGSLIYFSGPNVSLGGEIFKQKFDQFWGSGKLNSGITFDLKLFST